MIGALRLDRATYAEVAADSQAGVQCAIIVLVGAVFEAASSAALHGESMIEGKQLAPALVAAPLGWLVWSAILWIATGALHGERPELARMMRAVGLAHAPGLLLGLAVIPGLAILTGTLYFVSLAWFAAALVVAVNGVRERPWGRSVLAVAMAFAAHETFRQGLRLFGLAP